MEKGVGQHASREPLKATGQVVAATAPPIRRVHVIRGDRQVACSRRKKVGAWDLVLAVLRAL